MIKILEDALVQLENPLDQRNNDKELVDLGIIQLLEKRLDDVVAKRMREADNDLLKMRFATEARSQIQRYLKFWSSGDLGNRTAEKVKLLAQLDQANPFVVLRGEWRNECNKCEDCHLLKLNGVRDIKELLVKGSIRFNDTSIYALLGEKHSIDVSLKDVVKLYLQKALRSPEADMEIA